VQQEAFSQPPANRAPISMVHDFIVTKNHVLFPILPIKRLGHYLLPTGDTISEPVFVERGKDAAEGDGWLLAVVWRARENRSDLAVFNATDVEAGPVALVQLGHRVPDGFHGNWVGAQ
jgi:carotenoid cleavage dioxygenase-like enzyme